MTNKEITVKIKSLNVYKTKLSVYIKNHMPDVYSAIFDNTGFLDTGATFAERLYCIRHDVISRPMCPICRKVPLRFKTDTGNYAKTCSTACSRRNPETMEKFRNSLQARADPVGSVKARTTRFVKYGGWHSADFGSKCKSTLERKHGDPCWNNQALRRATCEAKYGVDHHMKNPEVLKNCMENFAKKHDGAICSFQLPEVIAKTKAGIRRRAWQQILADTHVTPVFSENEFMAMPDINVEKSLKFQCTRCGTVFDSAWDNGRASPCPKCCPVDHGTSNEEIEISEYLSSIVPAGFAVVRKTKANRQVIPPKEIDILVMKDGKPVLGIEFDGLYWHCDEYKRKNSHIDKTKACEAAGFRLVHVFESEWLTKKDLVKARLANCLGVYDRVVYARKCEVRSISQADVRDFLEKHHGQGYVRSKVRLGLYASDELVSVMTFGRCRFDKTHEWEMLRFCCKSGTKVMGGAGKLLAHFERVYCPSSLVSYADARWSAGGMYYKLGFRLLRLSPPNYWYFKHNSFILISRIRCQKHKLANLLENFDPGKSEVENMKANGYRRIFDCGNMVFEKTY